MLSHGGWYVKVILTCRHYVDNRIRGVWADDSGPNTPILTQMRKSYFLLNNFFPLEEFVEGFVSHGSMVRIWLRRVWDWLI